MRPHVSWADLHEGPVGVWGVGVEGRATLRKLRSLGIAPEVVVDDHPPAEAVEGQPVVAAADGGTERLARCRYVVKSPGISRHGPEAQAVTAGGATLVGGLGLWLEDAAGERVACITGTKGKSTTASIAGALAEGLGSHAVVAGNIGLPPFDPEGPSDAECWIVETSSFQAADVSRSPEVVVVTSLAEDHLDWHGNLATYIDDKLSLCTQPGARVTVANGDDPALVARRDQLGPEVVWVRLPAEPPAWLAGLRLRGGHNIRNALLAQRALMELGVPGADDPDVLAAATSAFVGLPSRLQLLGSVDGVRFVDDGLATNVLPTLAALEAFRGERVALLLGGHDRGVDYGPLAAAVAAFTGDLLVLTLPDNGDRIGAVLRAGDLPPNVEVRAADDLDAAVAAAHPWARPDGVVLLSPAAPSFGRFRDYRDRSSAFRAAVARCGPVVPPPG